MSFIQFVVAALLEESHLFQKFLLSDPIT